MPSGRALAAECKVLADAAETKVLLDATVPLLLALLRPAAHSAAAVALRLALPVALKLTECLVETESDGVRARCDAGIPMPLTSIAAENVYLTTRPTTAAALGWEEEEGGAVVLEAIEFV